MAEVIEELIIQLGASGQDDVIKALVSIGKAAEQAGKQVATAFAGVSGRQFAEVGIGITGAAAAFGYLVHSASEAAHSVEEFAITTGTSAESASQFEQAVVAMGGSLTGIQGAYRRLATVAARTWDEVKREARDARDKQIDDALAVQEANENVFKAQQKYREQMAALGRPTGIPAQPAFVQQQHAIAQAQLEYQKVIQAQHEAQKKADIDRLNDINNIAAAVQKVVKGEADVAQAGKTANLEVQNIVKGLVAGAGPGTADALKNFTGNLNDLAGMSPKVQELFLNLADFMKNSHDATVNAAVATTLFGRAMGSDLIPVLTQGRAAFQENLSAVRQWGTFLSKDAIAAGEDFHRAFQRLSGDLTVMKNQFALAFAPAFTEGMNELDKALKESDSGFKDLASAVADEAKPAIEGFFKILASGVHLLQATARELKEIGETITLARDKLTSLANAVRRGFGLAPAPTAPEGPPAPTPSERDTESARRAERGETDQRAQRAQAFAQQAQEQRTSEGLAALPPVLARQMGELQERQQRQLGAAGGVAPAPTAPLDKNTSSTDRNTAATERLTATMGGKPGAAPGAGEAPGAPAPAEGLEPGTARQMGQYGKMVVAPPPIEASTQPEMLKAERDRYAREQEAAARRLDERSVAAGAQIRQQQIRRGGDVEKPIEYEKRPFPTGEDPSAKLGAAATKLGEAADKFKVTGEVPASPTQPTDILHEDLGTVLKNIGELFGRGIDKLIEQMPKITDAIKTAKPSGGERGIDRATREQMQRDLMEIQKPPQPPQPTPPATPPAPNLQQPLDQLNQSISQLAQKIPAAAAQGQSGMPGFDVQGVQRSAEALSTAINSVESGLASLASYLANITKTSPSGVMQHGGEIVGGVPGRDSVHILGMPGEFMMRTAAVQHYGVGVMHMINKLKVPRPHVQHLLTGGLVQHFQHGGIVNAMTMPLSTTHVSDRSVPSRAVPSATFPTGRPLTIYFGGEAVHGFTATERAASDISRIAVNRAVRRGGTMPQWYTGT